MNAHTVPKADTAASAETEDNLQTSRVVSDGEFEAVVRGALEAVGGTLLFRMLTGEEGRQQHAAAAFVGVKDSRQYLVLTLPISGGQLRVETAARSSSPVAMIAASYASVAEAFAAAA